MSQKLNSTIVVIGIDIGKNSFHVVATTRAAKSCAAEADRLKFFDGRARQLKRPGAVAPAEA
jgi:hypothetical protein